MSLMPYSSKGNAVGELMFYGKGAGPLPTGSAVMGDILMAAKEICRKQIIYNKISI